MAKIKSKYVCQNCGYESAGYLGKCPECSSWASFVEESIGGESKNPDRQSSEADCSICHAAGPYGSYAVSSDTAVADFRTTCLSNLCVYDRRGLPLYEK